MIRCAKCGTTNPAISQFCDQCGESLQRAAANFAVETKTDFSDFSNSKQTMIEPEVSLANVETIEKADFPSVAPEKITLLDIENVMPENQDAPVAPNENPPNAFAAAAEAIAPGETRAVSDSTPFVGHARLLIERGKSTGKEFILSEEENNIGRWDADNGIFPDVDLDADDPEAKISRRHARIVRYGEQYLIEDLGSTNGTFVNRGRRLLPGNRQLLTDGDELIVGKTFLRFQIIK